MPRESTFKLKTCTSVPCFKIFLTFFQLNINKYFKATYPSWFFSKTTFSGLATSSSSAIPTYISVSPVLHIGQLCYQAFKVDKRRAGPKEDIHCITSRALIEQIITDGFGYVYVVIENAGVCYRLSHVMVLCANSKNFALFVILCTLFLCIVLLYTCPFASCPRGTTYKQLTPLPAISATPEDGSSSVEVEDILNNANQELNSKKFFVRDIPFDMRGSEVLVFLHTQKTGGSNFERHLAKNLDIPNKCICLSKTKKRCSCTRPDSKKQWLISRYSTGWNCGLHADWTELHACVPKYMNNKEGTNSNRTFVYATYLRQPVARFVSEFRHIQRGATWKTSLHMCNGRRATAKEIPKCYEGEDWRDVTLPYFLNCSSNLAINRQTRMLADLTLVNCYNKTSMTQEVRNFKMLQSAKANLRQMPFFGILEYQKENQYLFEKTFGLKFIRPFKQENATRAQEVLPSLDSISRDKIKELNALDEQLYSYAKFLFFKKLKYFRSKEIKPTKSLKFKNLKRSDLPGTRENNS